MNGRLETAPFDFATLRSGRACFGSLFTDLKSLLNFRLFHSVPVASVA